MIDRLIKEKRIYAVKDLDYIEIVIPLLFHVKTEEDLSRFHLDSDFIKYKDKTLDYKGYNIHIYSDFYSKEFEEYTQRNSKISKLKCYHKYYKKFMIEDKEDDRRRSSFCISYKYYKKENK